MNKQIVSVVVALGIVAALVFVAACTAPAFAGGGGGAATAAAVGLSSQVNAEPLPRTISVNGIGQASATPDVGYVSLGVESVNADPAKAVSENTEKTTAIMSTLEGLGIAKTDVQTANFSMWIEQVVDRQGNPTGETKYHVSNQMRIKVTDMPKIGEVLQQTLQAGANTVSGVEFTVADQSALQRQAREAAIANAKSKAEQLATGFGAKLGAVHQINEFSSVISPAPMMDGIGGGGGPVPISAGSFNVQIEIQVIFDLAE